MASLAAHGENLAVCCGKNLIAIHNKQDRFVLTTLSREPFVFDCSKAEQKPKESDNKSEDGGSEEKGSDRILAFAFSTSGSLLALTDDNKRLVLFRTHPSWECVSTRWVVRRCTSLQFTWAEDQVLVADKSGDVYSFSVSEPEKPGELKLGHLSMLLGVAVSTDDRYVITADRDEKIRVSLLSLPHNIQSFCLGHCEFVSCLSITLAHPQWLLSGSGDGTVKLWEYESGRRLQSLDLKEPRASQPSDGDTDKRAAVSRIAVSPDGRHVAVLCESVLAVQLFRLEKAPEGQLTPGERLALSHCVWDLTFDPSGRLWVLQESKETPIILYSYTQDCWKCCAEDPGLRRVLEVLRSHWDRFQDSVGVESCFKHLYKVNFDNMATYLQRKQERIQKLQQKKAKKRAGQPPQSNGASKKKKAKKRGGARPVVSS
ncbi:tRNA (guanine-N(7)-)-methyltransferase non-catalytic subunit wdr4 isoform X1 [Anguilla anguilla]|uniref:tRNA (guanine-N(7)-)-methyltransferase non-catalytic subunit wdr4 isoform X1 n=1 Tax=Anguilla anguilla TaxID=7936 RepID=UPI0015AC4E50|nr:tRNA (guanine-N(7)-)-methyltransferase non-catalytic subunit wdr4 isoform X1 [Anguilla anguilla]